MKISQIKEMLLKHEFDEQFKMLTCNGDVDMEIKRYGKLLDKALKSFGDVNDAHLICAPGRSEIGGNHTDHQFGRVLAGSVNMDIACVACKNDDFVEYLADDYKVKKIYLNDLISKEEEKFTTESLIRGILFRFKELGYKIGGFKAYSHSNVLRGSGISSSAAFEILIGNILNYLYNDGTVNPIEIAKIGQYAENNYFKKPSGLLDQMACSIGGFVTIDFKDNDNPVVEPVDFDFTKSDYALILVDTKGDHADLSDEYGLMPYEMKEVAKVFDKKVLSEISMDDLLKNIDKVKERCSDRSILRAIHFLNETDRVLLQVDALKKGDFDTFKKLIIESGYSSYMYLQNVYSNAKSQNLSLALAVSEQLLKDKGAYRVHGGGLAGTIQAFVLKDMVDDYIKQMNLLFGENCCHILSIRPVGGYQII